MSGSAPLIEVLSTDVRVQKGVSKRTGNPYEICKQEIALHKPGSRYPDKGLITLEHERAAYSVGFYEIDSSSFYFDQWRELSLSPILRPVPAPAKSPA